MSAEQATAADAPIVFPISIYPDAVFVPVTIAGAQHLCVVDSGSTGYAFHTSLRQQLGDSLGNKKITSANGGLVQAEMFAAPTATLGPIALSKDVPAACVDLTAFREVEGRNVEGLLGMPLFQSCIVQMDFDAHRLAIYSPATESAPEWGQAINVSYNEAGLPTIPVTLGAGFHEECIVDTGSTNSLSFASKLYAKLIKKQLIVPDGESTAAMINGLQTRRRGRIRNTKVGDVEKNEVLVDDGGKASRIGLDYLRLFRVTFDIPQNRIFFAKGTAFDKPRKQPAVGIRLLVKNEKTMIAMVQPGSPAADAGVLANDELLSVAGESIAGRPTAEVRWMFREKAELSGRLNLEVRRGSEDRNIVVQIRR